MKHLILVLALGLTPLLLAEQKPANAADYYKAGEAALKRGDTAQAAKYYRATLQLSPTHGNAKFRLASMKTLKPEALVRVRQARMKSINLPT